MKEISVYPGFWTGILHFLHGMNRSIKGYPMHRKALAQQICVSRRDVDKLRGRAEIFGLLMGWHSALFISTFHELKRLEKELEGDGE